ncbi:glucuronate isomerase [uncultured Cetobacterium sp.]|uniref:glucuronate isomerase n=1 Tax=uncultured Cetobacterium sp. TaxID=527638 RepID=UPI0025E9DF58|nr:glucuronate isomerase [uncultured Cetobacterium sp.]
MRKFMDSDFLLKSDVSKKLYEYAEKMPIFDYHCHLNPKEIAENKSYENITQIWLYGDHYKWRAMRSNGIDEKYITGDATDFEKFLAFAETMEYAYGNPLFHWSHLELKRYFGIEEVLNRKTAEAIWNKANELLKTEEFRAKKLIERSNVKALCTTDDPIDTLEYHQEILKDENFKVKVLPTFRPDKAIYLEKEDYLIWLSKLESVSNEKIDSFEKLVAVLETRVEYFKANGCLVTDHSLEAPFFTRDTENKIEEIFKKRLADEKLTKEEADIYKTEIFLALGKIYYKNDLGMQLHMGALRNNNERMFKRLGADVGFDSIADNNYGEVLSKLLNSLDVNGELPKTILYCLNPKDNEVLGTMIGNFQNSDTPGKIQFGSGWWFNDQKDGMIRQMTALSQLGLLRRFVGMLTDSRSFLSYTRHEYFRRILCNLVGTWVEDGEVPYDEEILKAMIEEICFINAKNYFKLEI